MAKILDDLYLTTPKINWKYKNKAIVTFLSVAKVEIKGIKDDSCSVKFIDKTNNHLYYETKLKGGYWAQANPRWYIPWKVVVDNEEVNLDLKDKNVLITYESSAIGDTIAWFPYIEEFRKKHNCNITVSTFHNWLFEENYKNIEFHKPGVPLSKFFAWYKLGSFDTDGFYDEKRHKVSWREIPLQKLATDILGLEYKEIVPKLIKPKGPRLITHDNYVTISPHSTMKAKLWNNPNGWKKIIKYLNEIGYKVICVSKEFAELRGVVDFSGKTLKDAYNAVYYSKFHIGLGSGLSWAAWGANKPVVLISGFSKPFSEFQEQCYRVFNENVCNGCYNDIKVNFDRSWNWCPRNKKFICSKSITSNMVIEKIDKLIEDNNF